MALRGLSLPWSAQPTEPVRPREKYQEAQIFVPGWGQSADGRFTIEAATASGQVANTEFGKTWQSGGFNLGFQISELSGGTWDGILFFPTGLGGTSTLFNIYSSGAGGPSVRASATQLIFRASSGDRLSLTPTGGVQRGSPVFFNGRAGNYLLAHNGEFATSAASFGSHSFNRICQGSAVGVSGMFVRFPNWSNGREEDILRLLADPYGELLEPQRIWVPVSAAGGGTDFEHVGSGGIAFAGSGASVYTGDYAATGSGGLAFAGAGTVSYTGNYAATGSGGLAFAGAASASFTNDFTTTASGGLTFAGAATYLVESGYEVSGSGGIAFAGAAAVTSTGDYAAAASGGLSFGGAAAASSTSDYAIAAAGGLVFAGTAAAEFTAAGEFIATGSGGFVLGGAATAVIGSAHHLATGSGGLQLGGAAAVEFISSEPPAPAPAPVGGGGGGGRGAALSATFLPRQRGDDRPDPLERLRRDDAAILRMVRQLFADGAFDEEAAIEA